MGNLHCGRCGAELNDWAVCQPCRLVDAMAPVNNLKQSSTNQLESNWGNYKDDTPYKYCTDEEHRSAQIQSSITEFVAWTFFIVILLACLSVPLYALSIFF